MLIGEPSYDLKKYEAFPNNISPSLGLTLIVATPRIVGVTDEIGLRIFAGLI